MQLPKDILSLKATGNSQCFRHQNILKYGLMFSTFFILILLGLHTSDCLWKSKGQNIIKAFPSVTEKNLNKNVVPVSLGVETILHSDERVPINLSSESDVATINKLKKSNFINSKIDKNNPTHTNENEDNRVRNDEENRIPGIHTDASARSPTAKQRLPGAIIIGMSKAGTRALNDYLTLNPNIKGTKREVHFFERDKNYSKGYEWYKGQLAYSEEGQLTIERTPRYVVSDNVPERIYRMNSSIKILVIVKEPLTRAISEYVHNCAESAKYRRKTFEQYSIISETGEVNTNYKPISKSVYFKYMPKWYRYFPQDQIFVVDGDNMITNPLQEINKVERFLGFTPQISEKNIYFNTTKGFYCMRARHIDSPKCLAKNKGRPHPVIRPDVVKKLHQYFRPLNEKFFLQIGKRFDWP